MCHDEIAMSQKNRKPGRRKTGLMVRSDGRARIVFDEEGPYPAAPISPPEELAQGPPLPHEIQGLLPAQRRVIETYLDHMAYSPDDPVPSARVVAEMAGVTVRHIWEWLSPLSPMYSPVFARAWAALGVMAGKIMWPVICSTMAMMAVRGNPGAARVLMDVFNMERPGRPGVGGQVNILIANDFPRPERRPAEFRRDGTIEVAVQPPASPT